MDRAPGPSVRLKLTLSYAGFLMVAGADRYPGAVAPPVVGVAAAAEQREAEEGESADGDADADPLAAAEWDVPEL